jgi:divalent metal cation (Fe/Co/Zn/Cd) transporter
LPAPDAHEPIRPRVDGPPPRRAIPLRHSVAALRAGESGRNQRSIVVALFANLVVAAAKLVAGLTTGSAALLAEAAHSTADSVNELLLGLSLKRGRRPSDAVHPLGHGGARFLWAFMAAIASFLIGGCLSIALAVRELLVGTAVERYLVAWVVLAVAFVADGPRCYRASRRRDERLRSGTSRPWISSGIRASRRSERSSSRTGLP